MILVDVIALERLNDLKYRSGNYKIVTMIPNGDPLPESADINYEWKKIATNVSEDEGRAIMGGFPHATQPK